MESVERIPERVRFGRCELLPYHRELRVDGNVVPLGSRAFDVLLALVEARGRLVTKDEVLQQVWPGVIVEENTLQVQISTLRKTLAADRDVIKTISGRGYRFVADMTAPDARSRWPDAAASGHDVPRVSTNLPAATSELIGRDDDVQNVRDLTTTHRLVTLVGAGGIGKSRLALAAASQLVPMFEHGVWHVDLAAAPEQARIQDAIAEALHLDETSSGADPVAAAFAGKAALIVLDNCEHMVEAAAEMVEGLLQVSARVRVLVTTREALRCEGEHVLQVRALDVPLELTAGSEQLMQYAAVKLFAARACLPAHLLSERQVASAIASVCHKLDGIPLAIELAAARVAALGIEEIATRLDRPLTLLSGGRRTARARHRSLRASLDWSYETLSGAARELLHQLAALPARFDLDAVIEAGENVDMDAVTAVDCISDLVSKSLVIIHREFDTQYSLLHTTRAYAVEKADQADAAYEIAEEVKMQTVPRYDAARTRSVRSGIVGSRPWRGSVKRLAHSGEASQPTRRAAA